MRERFHPNLQDIDLPTLLQAFSEPLRLRIVDYLDRHGETACIRIYDALGISKAAASHHFRKLRESGIIRAQMHGRDLHTRLRRQELEEYFPGMLDAILASYRRSDYYRASDEHPQDTTNTPET